MPLCSMSKVPCGARRASTVALAVATIATTTIPGETALASSTEGLRPAQAEPCPAAFPDRRADGRAGPRGAHRRLRHDTRAVHGHRHRRPRGRDRARLPAGHRHGVEPGASPSRWDLGRHVRVPGLRGRRPARRCDRLRVRDDIADRRHHTVLGDGAAAQRRWCRSRRCRRSISPPPSRRSSWRAARSTAKEVASGLTRLTIPVGVSGMSRAPRRFNRMIMRHLHGVRIYAAGRASAEPAQLELVPGGNVGVAMSYGDVTAGGVGTVTAVCGDEALLFGHPATFGGATTLSAHEATAVFVQPDPSSGRSSWPTSAASPAPSTRTGWPDCAPSSVSRPNRRPSERP